MNSDRKLFFLICEWNELFELISKMQSTSKSLDLCLYNQLFALFTFFLVFNILKL